MKLRSHQAETARLGLKDNQLNCTMCGKEVVATKYSKRQFKTTGRAYCSRECSGKYRSDISSRVMAETNRKYASERMKRNNPMADPVAREKMIATLKAIGHCPKVKGGNGQLTRQQETLAKALGWPTEYVIPTKGIPGTPQSYKADIACPEIKLAIEVDGHSHTLPSRRDEDRKKERALESLGWKVLRFWNQEIDSDIEGCLAKIRLAEGKSA
jgi:hypothetical protein